MKADWNLFFSSKWVVILLVNFTAHAQIPIRDIKKEVLELRSEEKIESYWSNLYDVDQKIIVKTKNKQEQDSLSVSNMIKTYYLWKIHGRRGYNKYNNVLPVLNIAHSGIAQANLAYWPILLKYYEYGGAIENFGGKKYAYPLEAISLSIYNYSIVKSDSIYSQLLKKLSVHKKSNMPKKLNSIFLSEQKLTDLKEVEKIGKWILQPLNNIKEEECFDFVRMSDDNYYLRKSGRIQKMNLIQQENSVKTFQIENEPFGWTYVLNSNNLKLINEHGLILIEYTQCM